MSLLPIPPVAHHQSLQHASPRPPPPLPSLDYTLALQQFYDDMVDDETVQILKIKAKQKKEWKKKDGKNSQMK